MPRRLIIPTLPRFTENVGEVLLVLEYVEGTTLRRRFAETISTEQFFDIVIQWAEGLRAARVPWPKTVPVDVASNSQFSYQG